MDEATKPAPVKDRGRLRIDEEECKGCGLCIEACPPKVIALSERMNRYGYRTAVYAGSGCTGCGVCFLACPEFGAITVLRLANSPTQVSRGEGSPPHEQKSVRGDPEPGAPRSSFEGVSQCASN